MSSAAPLPLWAAIDWPILEHPASQWAATFTVQLALALGVIVLLALLVAAGVSLTAVLRSRVMPSRKAQHALAAARREFRRLFHTARESEARLLHSMAGAGFGAWSVDLATGKLWRSSQYDVIFGYKSAPPHWTLRAFLDHVVSEDRESVETLLRALRADTSALPTALEFECRIRRADGQIRWIQAQGTREPRQWSGSMIFGLVHDITARKQAEALLTQSRDRLAEKEQRLAEAQHIAQVGSWDCDYASNTMSGSAELCRIFGLPPGEFHGSFEDFLEFVHPEDRGLVRHSIETACQTMQPFFLEHRIIQPDGAVRLIEAQGRVLLNKDGVAIGMAGTGHDITERQAAEEHLHRLAHYDSLTGLPNRRLFNQCLEKEVASREEDRLVALFFLDLDRFKQVNDTFGHSMGDELLRQVSERLLACVRTRDTLGRLGGDEFALVANIANHPDDAAGLAQKLITALHEPFMLGGHEVIVTPSIGVALCPVDSCDAESLTKYADIAMYHAKAAGRNAFRFYKSGMNARAKERLELETALRKAIVRGEFVLHYQPEVDLESGQWKGAEALLRWNRPGHGLVAPAEFVPALEESGLIVPVGRWIVDAACKQLSEWRKAGIGGISVSVNVSANQVRPVGMRRGAVDAGSGQPVMAESDDICEHVASCLRRHGIDPESLELELTETALMSHAEKTVALLSKLKALGIQILVDDFGTGYSSLSYLKRFPIDTLKIDREFIGDLQTDAEDRAITRAIITLAHSLNLKVIAEGVETREQLEFLKEESCDQAQGFYIARPMPPGQLLQLFNTQAHGPRQQGDRQPSLFTRNQLAGQRTVH